MKVKWGGGERETRVYGVVKRDWNKNKNAALKIWATFLPFQASISLVHSLTLQRRMD